VETAVNYLAAAANAIQDIHAGLPWELPSLSCLDVGRVVGSRDHGATSRPSW